MAGVLKPSVWRPAERRYRGFRRCNCGVRLGTVGRSAA